MFWPMLFSQEPSEAIRAAAAASVRRSDPQTSVTAAQVVAPGLTEMEQRILGVASRTVPRNAFTFAELVEHAEPGRWMEYSIRTRVSNLGQRGLLVKADDPVPNARGRDCDAWLLP